MDTDDFKVFATLMGIVTVIAICLFGVLYRSEEQAQATGISWERSTNIEMFKTVRHDDWSYPSTATVIKRHSEIRSWERYRSGSHEECTTIKNSRSCTTVIDYSSRPVYDTMYLYDNDEWAIDRTKKMQGRTFDAQWPDVSDLHDAHNPPKLGDEKPGMKTSRYTVYFKGKDKDFALDITEQRWRMVIVESKYTIILNIFGVIQDVKLP